MNKTAMAHAIMIVGVLNVTPILLFAILAIIRQRRKATLLESTSPAFEAAKPTRLDAFLSFLEPAKRLYLRRQLSILLGGAFLAWTFLDYFSSGLLSPNIASYSADLALPLRIWYSYLFHLTDMQLLIGMVAFGGAAISVLELALQPNGMGNFIRTRPLSRAFLFWTRIASMLFTILASLALAAVLSFALLLALHGPVWRHLPPVPPAPVVASGNTTSASRSTDDEELANIPIRRSPAVTAAQTSLPRLFLSMATTICLGFSLLVALVLLPIRSKPLKIVFAFVCGYGFFIVYITYVDLGSVISPAVGRILFLYPRPGVPPPYLFALVPLALTAALLTLAAALNDRYES